MNNQMPYGFMPPQPPRPQTCHCRNEIRAINDRIDNLERQLRRLERRVNSMPGNNIFARTMPENNMNSGNDMNHMSVEESYPNNYML